MFLHTNPEYRERRWMSILFILVVVCSPLYGQNVFDDTLTASELKKKTLEELMQIDITLVSKTPEPLFTTPASIYVISDDEIRRSGATSLPEALRLAPNLNVTQIDSRQWLICARGFNSSTPNKLLALIDGRSVYTPLYSGILWDVQSVPLDNIERIEIISGPGGTVWGTNAMNGVINIITKEGNGNSSGEMFITVRTGSTEKFSGELGYAGAVPDMFAYRVYLSNFNKGETRRFNGDDGNDSWASTQAGINLELLGLDENDVTIQGDMYDGMFSRPNSEDSKISGGNLRGKWVHRFSPRNSLSVQSYFDNTYRHVPLSYTEALTTVDLDFQHQFPIGSLHEIVWGAGLRYMSERVSSGSLSLAFLPEFYVMRLYTGFIQYEYSFFNHKAKLTIGSKVEHNDFSGFEYQPSAKLSWSFTGDVVAWASVTRAVRSPSRIDRDLYSPALPPFVLGGGMGFISEKVIAYEAGYRFHPAANLFLEIALFYNSYDDLRSIEPPVPYTIQNGLEGNTSGLELFINYQATDWWRLKPGLSYLSKHIELKYWSRDVYRGTAEGNDAPLRFHLQSQMDLPAGIEMDVFFRFVDELPLPTARVPAYAELDLRLGYSITEHISVSIAGLNLFHEEHPEYRSGATGGQIPRSVYGKLVVSY